MLVPVLLFIVGLLFLIKGGDWFVDGASALARRFHLPELLIGATVVSIGTTLPEVMVSTMSAVSGHGEIAYGNAIGSVICNSALIAAITIAVRPGKVDPKTLRVPVAFFFAAAAIYCVAAYAMGEFTRPLGFVMLAMFVAYMVANVLQMKKAPAAAEAEADGYQCQYNHFPDLCHRLRSGGHRRCIALLRLSDPYAHHRLHARHQGIYCSCIWRHRLHSRRNDRRYPARHY